MRFFITIILCSLCSFVHSQDTILVPKKNIFVEGFGAGLFMSVNYDMRFQKSKNSTEFYSINS
jgi:hypothetical protein